MALRWQKVNVNLKIINLCSTMMTSLEDSGIGDTNTANDLKKMNLLEMSGDHTILEHVLMAKASASNSNTPDSLENNTNAEDEEVIDISMIQL